MRARIILVAVIVVGLAACSTGGDPAPTNPPAAASSVTPWEPGPPATSPPTPVLTWGGTATWPDGVTMTVTKPAPIDMTDWWAQGTISKDDFPAGVTFEVTVVNGSGVPVEVANFGGIAVSVDSGTANGEPLTCESDVSASGTLQPGRTATWPECWAVQDTGDVVVTGGGAPDSDREDWIWQ